MKLTIHRSFALLFFVFSIHVVHAQTAYSLHKLEPGETLSAIAKSYHTTVGDIMRLNGMNAQTKLQPGEQIKIPAGGVVVPAQKPVTAAPAPVVTQAPPAANVPKTHVVATGETLYRISKLYNIPVEQLKTINNLSDGGVKVGQTILLAAGAVPAQQSVRENAEPAKSAPKETTVQAPPKQTSPQTKEPVAETPVKQAPAVSAPVQSQLPPVSMQTADMTKPEVIVQENNNAFANNYPSSNAPKEGFFTDQYGKEISGKKREQSKDGAAMTFKSASGWADKKYYILMNEAPAGSIVKIRNGRNELYAKVLWNLSEMKENEGLAFRISTAAAAALGITDQKFDLKVSYYE